MVKLFVTPFASSGDKATIPDPVQGSGSVSYAQGWGADYSKAKTDPGYKPVGRTEMNQALFDITEALLEQQNYGFSLWQSRPGGWPQHARVLYNGVLYRSTANDNTSVPPGGNWVPDVDLSGLMPKSGGTFTGLVTLSGNASNNLHAVPLQQVNSLIGAVAMPSGVMAFHGSNSAPSGWLKCNGAAISRTTYASLFAAIGTTWGAGNGSTTFNVPDLRGLFLRGWADDQGTYDNGRAFASLQTSDNKSHNHNGATGGQSQNHTHTGYTDTQGWHTHGLKMNSGDNGAGGLQAAGNARHDTYQSDGAGNHTHNVTTYGASVDHTHAIASSGGSESRPVNKAALVIIKI